MSYVSTLGQSLDQIKRLKTTQADLHDLMRQLSTGKKTDQFKGLGTQVITSQRARADLTELQRYNDNITIADRRIKLMMNSLQEIKAQAENVTNALIIQTQQGEFEMESISDLAGKAATFIRDLMNTQDGDRYLFGGAASHERPIGDNGTVNTYMRTQLESWVSGTIDTDTLINSYHDRGDLNDSLMGYGAILSGGTAKSAYIRVDQRTEINYTVHANNDGLRDVLAALEMVASIDQVLDKVVLTDQDDPLSTVTAPGATKEEQNNNFYKFFNDLAATINLAIDKLDHSMQKLSQDHAIVTQIQNAHKLEQAVLEDTIATVENTDDAEISIKLLQLQYQLEASYRVTATLSSLSLVNFL